MAPNRNYLAMEVLVEELVRSGVTDACVSPGNRSAPLAFALARNSGVKVWTHVDERSAGFFALGLARATRRPVVVACTSGTAAANLLPAAVEAHHAGVALILLTADRPPELRERSAGQTIDQLGLYGSHARWSFDLGVPEPTEVGVRHVRAAACRAVAESVGLPAGVAHLNLPMRDPLDPSNEEGVALAEVGATARDSEARYTLVTVPNAGVSADLLRPIADRLATARRPLLYCGPLDSDAPNLVAAVRALAQRLDAPLLAEPISNLRRSEAGERLVGSYEALLRDDAFAAASRPDVIVRLGAPPTSRTVATWLDGCGAELVVLDEGGGWPDPGCRASHVVHGSIAENCQTMAAALRSVDSDADWCEQWAAGERRAAQALAVSVEGESAPFEGHIMRAIGAALPSDASVYVGNSLAVRDLDWFWPSDAPSVRVLANRGANGIDGFVSSVLGAAAGGMPVVGVCGDLSFFHDLGGLVAAQRLGVRACFVVTNNGGGGIFDYLPSARAEGGYEEHFEELFVTPLGIELGPLVAAHGVEFRRAERVEQIRPAIERALASATTSVVEVVVDRADSRAAHARAWAAARAGRAGE
ncbi:MAG: 2-succinyl-5-enolpyruvyl-6-hydroxy-3-cyclohexene-1-carboxylic-acid synthase [Candidatus Binatia bacterium]|nr:2-succinyl-5-enolpyruvyl-6-hydroxy-3-cyclohexene-1-carboxylic-acid synthase [Candidatus Binatia bacterium]